MDIGAYLKNNRGMSTTRALFWILFLAVIGYGGYKIIPPVSSYYMLKIEVKSESKLAHMYLDSTMVNHILEKAQGWNMPITADNITITRGINNLVIEISYVDKITLDFYEDVSWTLPFNIVVEAPIKESYERLR